MYTIDIMADVEYWPGRSKHVALDFKTFLQDKLFGDLLEPNHGFKAEVMIAPQFRLSLLRVIAVGLSDQCSLGDFPFFSPKPHRILSETASIELRRE